VDGGAVVLDCQIVSNSAANTGGGIEMAGATIMLDRCAILYNRVWDQYDGGGIYLSGGNVRNCLIAGNHTKRNGGGVRVINGMMENCTVVGNNANSSAGGLRMDTFAIVSNTIAYYNSAADDVYETTAHSFRFGCASDISHGINGSITNLPLFTDAGSGTPGTNYFLGDYSLLKLSPCRDAGASADWMTSSRDIAGLRRIYGASVDMGAYEFPYTGGTIFCIR